LFKNLYKDGEYDIKSSPYKIRGAFLNRKNKLQEELDSKIKETTTMEKIEDLDLNLKNLGQEITDKKLEIEILKGQYADFTGKAERDIMEMMRSAEAAANQLKEEKSKQGHKEGFDKGYTEGIEKGKAEIDVKYRSLIDTMGQISNAALEEKHKIINNMEEDIVNLSIDIAKKVVHKELSLDRNLVVAFVKEAIKKLEDKEKITIYANPEDIEIIKTHREEFRELSDSVAALHILPDELLERGECKLESKSEIIDTDINYQFGEIKKKLRTGE